MDVMRLTSVQQVARELGKGLRSVERQQVNVKPRLVYHKECVQCIQSKQQLVTWSVIMQVENGSSAIIPQHFPFTLKIVWHFGMPPYSATVHDILYTFISWRLWLCGQQALNKTFHWRLIFAWKISRWTTQAHWLLQPRPGAVRVLRFSQELFDGGHGDGGG